MGTKASYIHDSWLKKHARKCKYMHQYATDNAVNNTPNEILRG